MGRAYRAFLAEFEEYWRKNGYQVSMDIDGFLNLIPAVGILFSNMVMVDGDTVKVMMI